jgi:hypothetical protein
MNDLLNRRGFIRSLSLAGASLALAEPSYANITFHSQAAEEIQNRHFRIVFDRKKGSFSVYRADESPFLENATVRVNSADGVKTITQGYRHTVKSGTYRDALGQGERLVVSGRDKDKRCDIELHLTLYDERPLVTIEAFCRNVSQSDLVVTSIEPLRAIANEGGILHMQGVSKCLTNGEMYFDTGRIHPFGTTEGAITSPSIKGAQLDNGPIPGQGETIHSWWNAALFAGYERPSVNVGYLDNNVCLGNLLIARPTSDRISIIAESDYAPQITVKPGKTLRSNRVVLNVAPDPYQVLEDYAEAMGIANDARTGSIINGWCSWFYTLAHVTEEEVIRNTEFAAKYLKLYRLEYIQIDEGYQRWHGDWEGNERFPHGMKWLADQIKKHGFKAGLWLSPYVVSEPAPVFREHPDWFVKNPDGSPQRVGNWPEGAEPPADENPRRYCLDITHPDAAQWLHNLIHQIVNDWGYEMIKIDFVAWSILAAKAYHDPTASAGEVYRKGMEIMRKAAGDRCHILECGPGNATVGLIDSMRIELDVNYGYADAAWNTYFLDPACSAAAAARRYHYHGRTWTNDVDHLCMHLMSHDQSEAAATIIGMSGGNVMSGDRLTQLDSYRLDILKKITPSAGIASFPIDLYEGGISYAFAAKVLKPFGEWTVTAFFNPSLTESARYTFPGARLRLEKTKTYLAFDFWRQQFVGEMTDAFTIEVPPGSVRLLSLHEKSGTPQFLSTDRHVMQGAIELESCQWDGTTKTISGVSVGPKGTSHNVYVYVPGDHPWTWGGYVLFRDYDSYSLKLMHNNIIQVHVRFDDADRVAWAIRVDEFFK